MFVLGWFFRGICVHQKVVKTTTIDNKPLAIKQHTKKVLVRRSENYIFKSDKVMVSGYPVQEVAIKFEPFISFADFKTEIYSGPKAPLDFKGNPDALRFRTRIKEAYDSCKVPDFAGHFCFVEWFCGSPCQQSVIIDFKNGKIYDGESASAGYSYRAGSNMLVVNPPDTSGFYLDGSWQQPYIYLWNDKTKKFEERKATIKAFAVNSFSGHEKIDNPVLSSNSR